MSRTAHHIPVAHSMTEWGPGRPWRAVVLSDLRYSGARLHEAELRGCRPHLQALVATFATGKDLVDETATRAAVSEVID